MILRELIQSYNLFDLLGIESKPDEYKADMQRRVSEEALTRALETLLSNNSSARDYFDQNGLDHVDQEEVLEKFPELKTYIEDSVVNLKIEMVKRLVSDLKAKVEIDNGISAEDKKYISYILERAQMTLSMDIDTEVAPDRIDDLKLFYEKARELKFII